MSTLGRNKEEGAGIVCGAWCTSSYSLAKQCTQTERGRKRLLPIASRTECSPSYARMYLPELPKGLWKVHELRETAVARLFTAAEQSGQ